MERTTKEKLEDMQKAIDYLKRKKNDKVEAIQRCMITVVSIAIIFCIGVIILSYYRPIKNYYYMYNPSVTIEDKIQEEC